jgi:hypothetical protein
MSCEYLFSLFYSPKTAAVKQPGAATPGPSQNIYVFCGEAAPHN